jgi:electron transfer flavoprotein alpha/beta subunit
MGNLRSATVKGLMAVQKQPFIVWNVADLGITLPVGRSRALRHFIPAREVNGEIVHGDTPEAAGANLAIKLRETSRL